MKDFKGQEKKYVLLSICLLFGFAILTDLLLSISIIGYRDLIKKDYLVTFNKIHYTR